MSERQRSEVTLGVWACFPGRSGRLLTELGKPERVAGRMRSRVWNMLSLMYWVKQKQPQLWRPRLRAQCRGLTLRNLQALFSVPSRLGMPRE